MEFVIILKSVCLGEIDKKSNKMLVNIGVSIKEMSGFDNFALMTQKLQFYEVMSDKFICGKHV